MRNFALGILFGLGIGVLAGGLIGAPRLIGPMTPAVTDPETENPTSEVDGAPRGEVAQEAPADRKDETLTLRVIGAFPRAQPGLQPVFDGLESDVRRLTGGRLAMVYYEPGTVPEQANILKAVADGKVAAGLASPADFATKEPALHLYGGYPFGPGPAELLAWYLADGHKFMANAFTRLKVKGLACGMRPAEGGGWYRQQPGSLDEFKDQVVAMSGLGAVVLERLGAHAVDLDTAAVFSALESGQVFGAVIGDPASDEGLQIGRLAGVLMLPGWQRQASFVTLIINLDVWENLAPTDKRRIEGICTEALSRSLAAGEAAQFGALARLRADNDVTVARWPDDMLRQLNGHWLIAARDQAQTDNEFSLAWSSLGGFRARYATWRDLGYVK